MTLRDRIAEALPDGAELIVVASGGVQQWAAAVEPESDLHRFTLGGVACWSWWPTLADAAAGLMVPTKPTRPYTLRSACMDCRRVYRWRDVATAELAGVSTGICGGCHARREAA